MHHFVQQTARSEKRMVSRGSEHRCERKWIQFLLYRQVMMLVSAMSSSHDCLRPAEGQDRFFSPRSGSADVALCFGCVCVCVCVCVCDLTFLSRHGQRGSD